MIMLSKIIENYLQVNNIKNYVLTQKSIPLSLWGESSGVQQEIELKNAIFFVHNFYYIVVPKPTFQDINTKLIKVVSESAIVDYGLLTEFPVYYGFTFCKSNFISIHKNSLQVIKTPDNWVETEINGHIDYIELLKL